MVHPSLSISIPSSADKPIVSLCQVSFVVGPHLLKLCSHFSLASPVISRLISVIFAISCSFLPVTYVSMFPKSPNLASTFIARLPNSSSTSSSLSPSSSSPSLFCEQLLHHQLPALAQILSWQYCRRATSRNVHNFIRLCH